MQARLSMPASELKPHYDVIVVGSGYGGRRRRLAAGALRAQGGRAGARARVPARRFSRSTPRAASAEMQMTAAA